MITAKYNENRCRVESHYTGTITEVELLEYVTRFYTSPDTPRDVKVLEDARGAVYDLPRDIVSKIDEIMRAHIHLFECIKVAFVQDKPRETAYNILYEHLPKSDNFTFKVFSTMDAAESWLGGT